MVPPFFRGERELPFSSPENPPIFDLCLNGWWPSLFIAGAPRVFGETRREETRNKRTCWNSESQSYILSPDGFHWVFDFFVNLNSKITCETPAQNKLTPFQGVFAKRDPYHFMLDTFLSIQNNGKIQRETANPVSRCSVTCVLRNVSSWLTWKVRWQLWWKLRCRKSENPEFLEAGFCRYYTKKPLAISQAVSTLVVCLVKIRVNSVWWWEKTRT